MSALAIVFILVVCVAMPLLAVRAARQIERMGARPSVTEILISALITHAVVGVLAVLAARDNAITLFPPPSFTPLGALAGATLFTLAMLANFWRWRVLKEPERSRTSWLQPQTARDLLAWAGISLVAGVAEEVIYRGALLGLMIQLVGNEWVAIAICVGVFALGHWVQGRGAMLIVVLFALAFHLLVRFTGDLYTAIIVHVLYDFVAGALLWWLGQKRATGWRYPAALRGVPSGEVEGSKGIGE